MRSAAGPAPPSARWHLPAAAAAMAAIYFLGAKLGMALTFSPFPISLLWPPNALLLAALVLSPRHWWWGLIAAVFPAHLVSQAQDGVPLVMTLCWFVSNVSEAALGAWMMGRLSGSGPALRSARSVMAFLVVAVVSPFFTSFLDAAFVKMIGWGSASFFTLWEVRFFSNMLATLIFVPALVTCVQAPPGEFPRLALGRLPEAGLLAAGLVAACTVAFNIGATGPLAPSLLCLPVPFLVWAALRFGPSLISAAHAGVAVLVIIAASHRNGPFAAMGPDLAPLPVQLFLITMALPLLLLAGLAEDWRESQRRLQGSWDLLSSAFRASPDALAIRRKSDGRITQANRAWLRLLGRNAPQAGEGEFSVRDRHGQPRVVQLSARPTEWEGQPCDIVTARDITAQREAEVEADDLRRQLTHITRVASLTDFSATLAHELNQPLAAILSDAQAGLRMLSRDPPNLAEVRAILRDIADADKRAGVLIHHLRLLMKNSDEQFGPVDINHLVQQVLELVRGEFLARKVELKTSFYTGLPQVHGDSVQLQQLLMNLMLNACEAMQACAPGERMLSIDTHHGADGSVEILLRDTGPGIPADLIDKVFTPFYTTKANGLGLGLPICRKIVSAHGGTLAVQSVAGQGASFRCSLPAASRPGAPG